jgi:cyanophycinase-like exopeptidase
MKKGYLILNGGEAFSPRSRMADHTWLKLIRGVSRPRLVVVPVAAIEKQQKQADEVMRYFNLLGTFAQYSMIVDQRTANTEVEYAVLDKVEGIVLIDGSPVDCVERLRGTHTEATLHRALLRRAAILATGASAMALGAVYWIDNQWEKGLAVAPHLAVLPHHDVVRMRLPPERLLADLPQGVTLLGIDQATTVICHPDGRFQVEGEGTLTVYRSVDQQEEVPTGETIFMPPPADSEDKANPES